MHRILLALLTIIIATSCSDDDFVVPDLIEFEQITTLEAWNVHNAAGFLAAPELNSLFLASREPNPETQALGERILRYNVEDGSITEDFTDVTDFVTKEIHIQGDKIHVFGGQFVNSYDIDFSSESTTVTHGLNLSRFGSAQYNNEIYIWGGDLNDLDSDKIKKWNAQEGSFETIATLPARKAGAHGEIVDDKLYIFGGQEHWILEPPNDVVFIYDFNEGTIETISLPTPVFRTFTDVYKGKIFIAGQIADSDPTTADLDIFFAVFDPKDLSFKEIETSLTDRFFRTIHQMAIINDDIYVLYGDVGEDLGEIDLKKHSL